ncbi:MAG: hypothetical protein IAC13_08600 [Firmicutes bacterium]|uniref:ABC-2 family transporter protein n=1 Tax=Candidatus Scybalomonas excrementavium TaxID=2840943 RepID=A0A9D9I1L4_9FIRM|nr:hypothetical protein [Candidatus Scybalomonas excrementavium]
MKSFIFESLKKAMLSIPFFVSCGLVIVTMLGAVYLDYRFDGINIGQCSAIEIFLRGYYYSNSILPIVATIICTLPFSSCYAMDHQSGYEKNLMVRMGRKKYFQSRFCTTGIMGALSFLLPMVVYFIIALIFFQEPISQERMSELIRHSPYESLTIISPYLYVGMIVIHCSIFGMVYGVLGFAISFFIKKKYVAWTVPFFLTIVFSLFAMYVNLTSIEPMSIFAVKRNIHISLGTILGEFFVIFVGSYLIAKKKLERDMKDDKEF